MAFLASDLVQNILRELGQVQPLHQFVATGGSATTFINSNFANFETPPDQDAFKNYLAIVVRDTAGLSPEKKWSICSAYDDSTWTGTIATVTDSIASGDTIMLASQDKFPLQHILGAINQGLEMLGDIPSNKDTSLTTTGNQLAYDIPVGVKRGLRRVEIEIEEDEWIPASDARIEYAGANTASKIYFPDAYDSGLTIGLVYDGIHAKVNAYNDVINEYIHPEVATTASILKLLEWYNNLDGADNQSKEMYLEEQYRTVRLPLALAKNPIPEEKKMVRFFNKGEKKRRLFRGSI